MLLFFGQIRPGADPGCGQNRSRGPLLQETSSSDRKATATNRMDSNDLEACVFDVFLDFVILPYFNEISKVFNLHLFCVISMFVSGRMLI